MTEINKLFFDLIKVSLGRMACLSRTPSAADWQELYALANKQSLVGICFVGVQKLVNQQQEPPEMLYFTWMGMAAMIQQRNEVVNRQCVELQKRLRADGRVSCIMKGQAVASLYKASHISTPEWKDLQTPSPSGEGRGEADLSALRQSGDIDVWMKGGMEVVVRYANSVLPSNEINEQHVHFHVFENTEVELHYVPTILHAPIANRWLQKFFAEEATACWNHTVKLFEGYTPINAVTMRFNLVYLMAHMYRHLFGDGIGLRQLMDYYFVLLHATEKDKEDVMFWIERTGMKRFAAAEMWIMQFVFGLEREFLLCAPNQKLGEFLLNEISEAGNMGHYETRFAKGENESHWHRFWRVNYQNVRLIRFSFSEVFWTPLWRIQNFIWRHWNGYKD